MWTELGLYVLMLITITRLSNVAITYHGLPSSAKPLAGILFLAILIRFVRHGERPLGWKRASVTLAVFSLLWLTSLLHASEFASGAEAFVGFVKDAVGCVIVIFLIQRPLSLRRSVWVFIASGILMGSISVFQYATGNYNNPMAGFGGWDSLSFGAIKRHRLTGPYGNANAYAQVLAVIIPLALDRLWQERLLALRLLAGWSVVACLLTVLYTFSRGGFLALLFGLGVLLAQRRLRLVPEVLTTALLLGLVVLFRPSTHQERILTLTQFAPAQTDKISDPSFRGRLSENIAAWRMFRNAPLLGVGLGNFKVHYQDYAREIGLDPRRERRSPASLYLELLSEQGVVGTAPFLLLIFVIFRGLLTAQRRFRVIGMPDEACLTAALLAGLGAYMFGALFKNSAYANVLGIVIGVAVAAIRVSEASARAAEDTTLGAD